MTVPPLVSVVVPTYDRLTLLREAVQSVRAQSYPHWELLVVDDGSADGTAAYLDGLGDPRIRLLAAAHTGNVAHVRNLGMEAASGAYVAFLDSDDLWLPAKLATQLGRMRDEGVPWSYTRYEHIDEKGSTVPPRAGEWRALSGDIAREVVTTEAAVTICTVMVERRLLAEVGPFDEDLGSREDYDLILRLALRSRTLAVTDTLTLVRVHGGRSTGALTGATPYLATARVYDKHLATLPSPELRELARRRRAYHLAEAGARRMHAGALREGAGLFARALMDRPVNRQWWSALARGLGLKR